MAIIGIGIDLVDVKRFAQSIERTPGLAERLFTEAERALSLDSLAARFAAKEAIAKALGAPRELQWLDAEVVRAESGQPSFVLRGTVEARARELGVAAVHLSLTHDGGMASAFVVLES